MYTLTYRAEFTTSTVSRCTGAREIEHERWQHRGLLYALGSGLEIACEVRPARCRSNASRQWRTVGRGEQAIELDHRADLR